MPHCCETCGAVIPVRSFRLAPRYCLACKQQRNLPPWCRTRYLAGTLGLAGLAGGAAYRVGLWLKGPLQAPDLELQLATACAVDAAVLMWMLYASRYHRDRWEHGGAAAVVGGFVLLGMKLNAGLGLVTVVGWGIANGLVGLLLWRWVQSQRDGDRRDVQVMDE